MAATLPSSKLTMPVTANAPTCGSRRTSSRLSRSNPPNSASQQSINPSMCRARVRTIRATASMEADNRGGRAPGSSVRIGYPEFRSRSNAARIPPRINPTTGIHMRADAKPTVPERGAPGKNREKADG